MKNNGRGFVTALMILASLMLFGGSLVINQRVGAQDPTPKEATPSGAGVQKTQRTDQDCEKIRESLIHLNDALKELVSVEQDLIERLKIADAKIRDLDKAWAETQKIIDKDFFGIAFISEFEGFRGRYLDDKANWANDRRLESNHMKENLDQIQEVQKEIADLLNKLGECGAKTAKPPPQPLSPPGPFRPPLPPFPPIVPPNGPPAPNSIATTPTTPSSNQPTTPAQPSPGPSPEVALVPGYHVDTNAANGLFVTTFTTPQGKIKVNLTDDVAAGDTISGTVETEPAGKDETERAQNQGVLNGFVIELEGQKIIVGDKKFTCNIPPTLTPEASTIVLQHNGQTVATTEIPISATAPPPPSQFTLPTGGQQGKPIYIKGPCDGVFTPQDHVKLGPTILPPVAESPRSLVVLDLSDVVGPTNIDCNENGVAMQCPFHNIRVNLSALRLNLQRGETTTLHVQVLGLGGITEDEWLDLEDTSPTVIKMSGGEIQHIIIPRAQVQKDGTYSTDRTLTGIMAGGFGVTGTVKWSDVCTHPATH